MNDTSNTCQSCNAPIDELGQCSAKCFRVAPQLLGKLMEACDVCGLKIVFVHGTAYDASGAEHECGE